MKEIENKAYLTTNKKQQLERNRGMPPISRIEVKAAESNT